MFNTRGPNIEMLTTPLSMNMYLPFRPWTFLVLWSKKRQKASPPSPVLHGSVRFNAAATATAASAAFPPPFSISIIQHAKHN